MTLKETKSQGCPLFCILVCSFDPGNLKTNKIQNFKQKALKPVR